MEAEHTKKIFFYLLNLEKNQINIHVKQVILTGGLLGEAVFGAWLPIL